MQKASAHAERLAPHRLFGVIDGALNFSAGRWARAAGEVLAETEVRPVVFVGGTGLYFMALTDGLAEVPPTPPEIRDAWIKKFLAHLATDRPGDELFGVVSDRFLQLYPSLGQACQVDGKDQRFH